MSQAGINVAILANDGAITEDMLPKSAGEEKSTHSTKSSSKSSKRTQKEEISDMKSDMSTLKQQLSSTTEQMTALTEMVRQSLSSKLGMDTVTSGDQRPEPKKDNNPRSCRPSTSYDISDDSDDQVSLMPGQRERRDLCGSELSSEGGDRARSVCEPSGHKTDRFSRYISSAQENLSEETRNMLRDMFGEDATTKREEIQEGLIFDTSQLEILSSSWHIENPEQLTAYKDEYRVSFPLHESNKQVLNVPKFDSIVEQLVLEKHGKKSANTNTSQHVKLHSQPAKSIEKFAFQGQTASRMGVIVNAYIQQALGGLLAKLLCKDPNLDLITQMVRDIFAMSTKALDQVARAGAYHHVIRRKAGLMDTGLDEIPDVNKSLAALPLSSDGVFGKGLEQALKDRQEKRKQLKELLPELNTRTDKSRGSTLKRPTSYNSDNYASKKPRMDYSMPNSRGDSQTKSSYNAGQRTESKNYPRGGGNPQRRPGAGNSFRGGRGRYQK